MSAITQSNWPSNHLYGQLTGYIPIVEFVLVCMGKPDAIIGDHMMAGSNAWVTGSPSVITKRQRTASWQSWTFCQQARMAMVATAIAIVLAMNCAPTTARKVIFNENLVPTVFLFSFKILLNWFELPYHYNHLSLKYKCSALGFREKIWGMTTDNNVNKICSKYQQELNGEQC